MAAIAAYCRNCGRTVYAGEEDTTVCPVCSTPLIPTKDDKEPKSEKS